MSAYAVCVWVITAKKQLMTFHSEALQPRAHVRRYRMDTTSQPGLEGTLYESMCAALWHFNLHEQCDVISQPVLLTIFDSQSALIQCSYQLNNMLRANLQSVTWYSLSRSLHHPPGIFSLAMRLSYSFLLRWRNWVTVTIMHNYRLPVSQACLKEITATWRDANLATGEKLQSPLWGKSLITEVTN